MNNLNASASDKNFIGMLVSDLLPKINGTPDYSNSDEGVLLRVLFGCPMQLENLPSLDDLTILNDSEIQAEFPNGFHVLRVTDFERYTRNRRTEIFDVTMFVNAKQEGELSAEEKAEENEMKKRLKAEQELEAESLILDSMESGIVDLIRAGDETIKPYAEMSDAKKKVIRSHLKTLQALMRL